MLTPCDDYLYPPCPCTVRAALLEKGKDVNTFEVFQTILQMQCNALVLLGFNPVIKVKEFVSVLCPCALPFASSPPPFFFKGGSKVAMVSISPLLGLLFCWFTLDSSSIHTHNEET